MRHPGVLANRVQPRCKLALIALQLRVQCLPERAGRTAHTPHDVVVHGQEECPLARDNLPAITQSTPCCADGRRQLGQAIRRRLDAGLLEKWSLPMAAT